VTAAAPVVYERAPDHDPPPGADPPRVVFVHGSMDRSGSFIKVARRLPEAAIVRYDRAGYGRSSDLAPAASFDEQVDELLAVVGDRPSVVVGHSFGGVLALAAAERRPDVVGAVVAYESPFAWEDWWPRQSAGGDAVRTADEQGPEDAAERFMRRMIGDERWERLPPSTRAARRAEGPALVNELRLMRGGPAPFDPAAVSVPVIAAHGTESVAHHQQSARELAQRVPDGELVVIEGAGHGAHFSHPAEFAGLVRRALDRYSARHV
jgi:pimeloyl-ACP methyl ester carboxylesterase